MTEPQPDLLHPLTSLEWTTKFAEIPSRLRDTPAVCLNGKLYLGGEDTQCSIRSGSTVFCYDLELKSWKKIKSPIGTALSALTTYQGKLVLVGGQDDAQHETNKLWTLQDDGSWTDTLPPMPTPRWAASAVDTGSHLIVAGGDQKMCFLNTVEVFDGNRWTKAEALPRSCNSMMSTLHNGVWYLMGGERQGQSVFCAAVDSLVATAGSSERAGGSVWKTLPVAPLEFSNIVVYENLLLAIGGQEPEARGNYVRSETTIYGYITGTQSWVHIADLPEPITLNCCIVLPSRELLVVGEGSSYRPQSSSIFKATVRVDSFQLDSQLSVAALSRFQYATSVALFIVIGESWEVFDRSFANFLNKHPTHRRDHPQIRHISDPEKRGRFMVEKWLDGEKSTWGEFAWVLGSSKELAPLGDRINYFFQIQPLEMRIDELESECQELQKKVREFQSLTDSNTDVQSVLAQGDRVLEKRDMSRIQITEIKQKESISMEVQKASKELQSQLATAMTSRDSVEANIECALTEREGALEERDKLRIQIVELQQKEAISMKLQKEVRELQSQLEAAVMARNRTLTIMASTLAERDRALEERDKLRVQIEQNGASVKRALDRALKERDELRIQIVEMKQKEGSMSLSNRKRGAPSPSLSLASGTTTHEAANMLTKKPRLNILRNPPKFEDLMEEVAAHLPERWEDLATMLGLEPLEIICIEALPNRNPNRCYREVFSVWKKNKPKPYCWTTIVEVLESQLLGEAGLADEIEKRIQRT